MKTFKNQAAQGDILIRRIDSMPERLGPVLKPEGDVFIVAHSETGHHHVIDKSPNVMIYKLNKFVSILQIKGAQPVILYHKRDYDTHEALEIDPGIYEMRTQREESLMGIQKAID